MKQISIGLMVVLAVSAIALTIQDTSAATVSCNVAAGKPTTSSTPYHVNFNSDMPVNEYIWHAGGGPFVAALEDGLNSWWQVDLEQTRHVESITIYSQTATLHTRINDAWLRAYDGTGVQIGAETVLTGFDDETRAVTFDNGGLGWDGARYLKVGGEDGKGLEYLAMAEFQAFSQVQTYPGFIGGVTALSDHTYNDGADVRMQAEHAVNNMGMNDQSGPLVGNPNALHRMSNSVMWCTGTPVEVFPTFLAPSITFDLGDTYDLSRMLIWNSNQNIVDLDRGLKDVLIETSLDGSMWSALDDRNGAADGNFTIGISPATEAGEWIPYTGDVDLEGITAAHVRITAFSSYGAVGYWGLSEVRFYTEADMPQIPGDANGDQVVDAEDAKRLALHWGMASQAPGMTWWEMGDFNGDNVIDARDAAILAANWGYAPTAEATAIPEPSALAVLFVLSLVALFRRRT